MQEEEEVSAPVTRRRKVEIEEDEEDDSDLDEHGYMTPEGDFMCGTVVAEGLPKGAGIPTEVRPCLIMYQLLQPPYMFAPELR